MSINKASPIPLYYQLKQLILNEIAEERWRAGEVIPTEKELQERYDISRTTVRQALTELVAEGYLYRRRGVGTFVALPKLRHGPQRPFGLSGYLKAHGLEPGWHVLSLKEVPAEPRLAELLAVPPTSALLCFERLRLAGGEAIGLHSAALPLELVRRLKAEDLAVGDSSLSYLEGLLGLRLRESYRTIEAVRANEREAELLDYEENAPILLVRRTVIDQGGRPVEFLKAAYRGDRFEYYLHFDHQSNQSVLITNFEGVDATGNDYSA